MVLQAGDRVLIVHRRLFEKDGTRFFVGMVDEYDAGLCRVTGFTFYRDSMTGHVHRKDDVRTKVVALASGTLLVYVLPDTLKIENARIVSAPSKLCLADGLGFELNLSEH